MRRCAALTPRLLLLKACAALLLSCAVCEAPAPPQLCAPACETSADAVSRVAPCTRAESLDSWHDAVQLEQIAMRWEADAAYYVRLSDDVAAGKDRGGAADLLPWRNASRAQLDAEAERWHAARQAAAAAAAAARPAFADDECIDDDEFAFVGRPLVRLKPALFPQRVNVSFLLQYYKQPQSIQGMVDYYLSCTNGSAGHPQNPGLTSELVVNVDNSEDAAAWAAAAAAAPRGFVTLVVSGDVHETRGYNRAAAVARGDALILVQDDDMPHGSCAWLSNVTALLAAKPLVGVVGLKKACIAHHILPGCGVAWDDDVIRYTDPAVAGGLAYQHVHVTDFSPLVVRATAFADVGGCDEGLVPSGESGIVTDYELSYRMWAAGWHVTQMRAPSLKGGGGVGGTGHGISFQLRRKNVGLNGVGFGARFSAENKAEMVLEIRRKNAQLTPREGQQAALDAIYAAAAKRYLDPLPEGRAAALEARLAAIARRRGDDGNTQATASSCTASPPLSAGGAAEAPPAAAVPVVTAAPTVPECSFPCAAHATCNERERRCDCPPGLNGSDCATLAVPSCLLEAPGSDNATALQAPPVESRSCACIREWVALLQARQPVATWSAELSLYEVVCFEAPPGTPVHRVWEDAAAGVNVTQMLVTARRESARSAIDLRIVPLFEVDAGVRQRNELDAPASLDACPQRCSLHGACEQRTGGLLRNSLLPQPRCRCWAGRRGAACEERADRAPRDGSPWCLNACRGRGTCVRGTCACARGAWGADCGDSADGALRGRGPALQPPLQPSVFVYDWPPALVTWHVWLSPTGIAADWGRTGGWIFLETALRSAHRTLNGSEAATFVLPIAGDARANRVRAFDYAYTAFPYLNASANATHVWPIMPADGGAAMYSGIEGELRTGDSTGTLPPLFARTVFQTHHALHLGYARGSQLHNTTWWLAGVGYQRQPAAPMYHGMHVPGKDVAASAVDKQEQCLSLSVLAAQPKVHTFWWTGSVRSGAGGVRASVIALFANNSNVSGFAVHSGGGLDDRAGMKASRFCLAPPGGGGGYGSRDASALSAGCAPVYVQDHVSWPMEDLLPVSLYGAAVAEADLPRLPEILNATLQNRTHALRQLHCACRALQWPWVGVDDTLWQEMDDALLDRTDSEGGWASLLMLLDRRRRGAGPLADACDAVPLLQD